MIGRPKVYSPLAQSEAVKRVSTLSTAERTKLMLIAHDLAENTGWSTEDLLQEALTRIIAGTRTLPAEVPLLRAIFGVMKSIAFNVRKSSEGKIAKGSDELELASPPSDAPDDVAQGPEDAVADGALVQALYDKFAGEEQVQLVLMKLADYATREEICAELSIDEKAYATIRRRLRRAKNALSGQS